MAVIIILATIIFLFILYLILKPYFIKYHTTLLFTGEMGSGKTLNAVKTGVKVFKKTYYEIKIKNWFIKLKNKIRTAHNKKVDKEIIKANDTGKKVKFGYRNYWHLDKEYDTPRLISNIPIRIKGGKNPVWSNVLTKEMLTMKRDEYGFIEKIPEYSVVIIDEIAQLVDQFNWNIKEIQDNVNELITFFRHYTNGLLILTCQNDSQVVKQIRDKMNQFYWLSNFHKFLFIFYKCDICQFISSDVVGNVNTGFIEDNTKTTYGLLIHKYYDSRCYSERYTKEKEHTFKRWNKYKTNKIIRFDNYVSPLDTKEE